MIAFVNAVSINQSLPLF